MQLWALLFVVSVAAISQSQGEHDYIVRGFIEDVHFRGSNDECFIAVNEPGSTYNNLYHRASKFKVCKFAMHLKLARAKVWLYALKGRFVAGLSFADNSGIFQN